MIDYKIRNIRLSSQGIKAEIAIYKGDITTEQEENPITQEMEDVTRYRRSELLTTKNIELDHLKVASLFSKYANKKLAEEAALRGETVISEQNSTSV